MLDRLNLQFQDVSLRDWKLLTSLLLTANLVTMTSLGWLVLSWVSAPNTLDWQVMAQAPATSTPLPTFTTTPAGTLFPTNTLVPTWTAIPTDMPTNTPVPSDTPRPADTPVPAPVVVAAVVDPPTATLTPTPSVDFVASVRQLTPCENQGKHHLFIYVKDLNGAGMPNANLRVFWPGGEATVVTGDKLDVGPGFTDFAMYKGSYSVQMLDFSSEIAGPVSVDIPRGELCEETGNPVANSLYHYSYEVIFQQVR